MTMSSCMFRYACKLNFGTLFFQSSLVFTYALIVIPSWALLQLRFLGTEIFDQFPCIIGTGGVFWRPVAKTIVDGGPAAGAGIVGNSATSQFSYEYSLSRNEGTIHDPCIAITTLPDCIKTSSAFSLITLWEGMRSSKIIRSIHFIASMLRAYQDRNAFCLLRT